MPTDLSIKIIDRIASQYPSIDKTEIPSDYSRKSIEYRKDEIDKYDVIFWHRLLRSIYQEPLEIECEILNEGKLERNNEKVFFRKSLEKGKWEVTGIDKALVLKIEAGKAKPAPVNWKYLLRLPSGGIVEFSTSDRTTIFNITQVILPQSNEKNSNKEVKKLIDLILDEANRQKGRLFNPTKEFEKQIGIRLYFLFNVYLSNYLSANTMLDMAESKEADLRKEFLRYDARTSDMHDDKKREHLAQHMLTCGMFYSSAITFFFMALEGFVNLVFHAFLKKTYRDKDLRTEQRFDLEQKLRFMPSLCNGFNENMELSSTILSEFKLLKNYRNSLFHSKVEESLKSLCFVEGGFFYNYDMDNYKERFLSSHKIKLTLKDVVDVKNMVDAIINSILELMNHDTKMVTETYIFKEPHIPFFTLDTGELVIGKRAEV